MWKIGTILVRTIWIRSPRVNNAHIFENSLQLTWECDKYYTYSENSHVIVFAVKSLRQWHVAYRIYAIGRRIRMLFWVFKVGARKDTLLDVILPND